MFLQYLNINGSTVAVKRVQFEDEKCLEWKRCITPIEYLELEENRDLGEDKNLEQQGIVDSPRNSIREK